MAKQFGSFLWLVGLCLILSVACQANADEGRDYASEEMAGSESYDAEAGLDQMAPPPPPPPPPGASSPASPAVARKLIRTAELQLVVADVEASAKIVVAAVERAGGYIESERTEGPGGGQRQFTIRVPGGQLDTLMAIATTLAERVDSRSAQVVDATSEYVDVAARLATQRALAERLGELLKRANKVSDVLEVEREFARVTADIEAFEARLKSIDQQASLSTLELYLRSDRAEISQRKGFGAELQDALLSGGRGLREMLIVVVRLWPLWLVLGGFWALWRRRRRSTPPKL